MEEGVSSLVMNDTMDLMHYGYLHASKSRTALDCF